MERGDIWLVDLNPTAEHEQRGVRPVVIVSPGSFNQLTGTPVVVPVTRGGNFARRRGFTVSLDDAGTQTTGVIRCDQPGVVYVAARRSRRIESIPQTVMDEVLARLRAIIA